MSAIENYNNLQAVCQDHYNKLQAVCQEIKQIRRRMRQEFRAMNLQQKDEFMEHRNRFQNDFQNYSLIEEGLKSFAADCYEPVNIRDNSIIQIHWRRDHLTAPVLYN